MRGRTGMKIRDKNQHAFIKLRTRSRGTLIVAGMIRWQAEGAMRSISSHHAILKVRVSLKPVIPTVGELCSGSTTMAESALFPAEAATILNVASRLWALLRLITILRLVFPKILGVSMGSSQLRTNILPESSTLHV